MLEMAVLPKLDKWVVTYKTTPAARHGTRVVLEGSKVASRWTRWIFKIFIRGGDIFQGEEGE